MSDAPAVEEGELPSSPLTAEDEDLEEGEILESDNEENGEKEAKKSPEPPPRVGGQKEKEKDREREETSHRNTRKGIEVWADFYPTNRSVPSPRANRHSDDSPYSDSDPEREDRSYSRSRRDRYDDESHNRSHDREKRPLLRDEKTHEYLSRMRKEASRAPKPQPRVTCKFWARGVCRKGDECEFAHEGSRHKKKELCKFYSTGVCVRGRDCLFLHGEFPCKYYHTGNHCYDGPECRFSHDKLTPETEEILQKALNSAREEAANLPVPETRMQQDSVQLPRLYGSDDATHNAKIDVNPGWGIPHSSIKRQLIIVPGRPVLLSYPAGDVPAHLQSPLLGTRVPHVSEVHVREYRQQVGEWDYESRSEEWVRDENERKEFGDHIEQFGYQLDSGEGWQDGPHPNDWVPQHEPLADNQHNQQNWSLHRQPAMEEDIHMKDRHPNDWIPQRQVILEEPAGPMPQPPDNWASQRQPLLVVDKQIGPDWGPRQRSPPFDNNSKPHRGRKNDWISQRDMRGGLDVVPQFDLDEIPPNFDSHPPKKPRFEPEEPYTKNALGIVVGQVRSLAGETQENMGVMPMDSQMRHPTNLDPRQKGFGEPVPYVQERPPPQRLIEEPVCEQADFLPLSRQSGDQKYQEYRPSKDRLDRDRQNWNTVDSSYMSTDRAMVKYADERPQGEYVNERFVGGYAGENMRERVTSPPRPLFQGLDRDERSRQMDAPGLMDESRLRNRVIDGSRIIDDPRQMDGPRPMDVPRPMDGPRLMDNPREMDASRQMDAARQMEASRSMGDPRQMEDLRHMDDPRHMDGRRQMDHLGNRQLVSSGYGNDVPREKYSPPLAREYGRDMDERAVGAYRNEMPRDKFIPPTIPQRSHYDGDPSSKQIGQFVDERSGSALPQLSPLHAMKGYEKDVVDHPVGNFVNKQPSSRDRLSPQRRYESETQQRDMRSSDTDWQFRRNVGDTQPPRQALYDQPSERYNIDQNQGPPVQGHLGREERPRPNEYEIPQPDIGRDVRQVHVGGGDRQPPREREHIQPLMDRHADIPYDQGRSDEGPYDIVRRDPAKELRYNLPVREEVGYGYPAFETSTRHKSHDQFTDDRQQGFNENRSTSEQNWDQRPDMHSQGYRHTEQQVNQQEAPQYLSSKPSQDPHFMPANAPYQTSDRSNSTMSHSALPSGSYSSHYMPSHGGMSSHIPHQEPAVMFDSTGFNHSVSRQQPKEQESTIQASRDPRQRSRVPLPEQTPPRENRLLSEPRKDELPYASPTGTVLDIKMEMPPPKSSSITPKVMPASAKEQPKKQSLADLFKSIDPTASPFG